MVVSDSLQKNILVFDSGVGGLSVYKEISQLLPNHNYTYVFDNEAYPYGELDQQVLIHRVQSIVTSFVASHAIDIVVIACNTASTIVLPTLRANNLVPIVGVVPAIKPASLLANKAVGLIATPATITREYTHELIKNFSSNKRVELLGSTRLVDMAEDKLRGEAINLEELQQILQPMINTIDVAVLGCTHFPLIKSEIQQVLGKSVLLVDSGKAIAKRVQDLLDLESGNKEGGVREVFCSALPKKESALNSMLKQLGFSSVQLRPFLDV
ncbi:glutamate racemase [Vibrio splendidus]|nr:MULTISPECIES: glutamate racemase [Vibrio]MBO7914216.1 glutamate racemase [Vibrio sp. G41H]MCF7493081.1 glutamate racemase [Vibrio sp. G-C-1]OCH66569.1 glutamate racemase [Vibrio lentus]PMI59516.1 glutamate racemase [Vibrio lentus]PMO44562.1 glutamate racemase [Vibrio splendidus]